MTYEADVEGTLKIVAREGDTLAVGETIARIGAGGEEDAPSEEPEAEGERRSPRRTTAATGRRAAPTLRRAERGGQRAGARARGGAGAGRDGGGARAEPRRAATAG